ncbi:hypothetical protein [uncultured Croceitalea sp.]|uniref:hypothetical protein n=1 Tax=uncultured Croceitalea sp. TaxID=1798908 RepID=UPI003305F807
MFNKVSLLIVLFLAVPSSSYAQTTSAKEKISQRYTEQNSTTQHQVALDILAASKVWITNFNKGNKKAVIEAYAPTAVMCAMPFGVKQGRKDIEDFWVPFIESGATNLVYTDVSIEVVNDSTAFLSANWSMNVGRGVIYHEKWEKINGKWSYTYDNFEVLEQYDTPLVNTTDPIASHTVLEEIIRASMQWTNGFNAGKGDICGNGYIENATMNAVPFASIIGKKEIQAFWTKLIADGAKNLIYNNPKFEVLTPNSAVLSADWSMNIGKGKIYQEKWEKKDGKWLLTYDEFEVLKQY